MLVRSFALVLVLLLFGSAPAWCKVPTQPVVLELTGMR
jgi:hypothetical protein